MNKDMKYIVNWEKDGDKYRIIKKVNGIQEYFGTLDTIDEAIERRDLVLKLISEGKNAKDIKKHLTWIS